MRTATEPLDESRVDLLLEEIAESEEPAERCALLLDLADVLCREHGDPERALRSARLALEEKPDSEAAADVCANLLERCGHFSELADFLVDRMEVARELQLDTSGLARRLAILAGDRLADPARALLGWEEVVRRQPADCEALGHLVRLHADAGRLRDRLRVLCTLAELTESPGERAALHRELAAGYEDLDQLELAAEHLEWAVAHQPGSSDDLCSLGRIYLRLSRVHAAIDAHARRAALVSGIERAHVYLEMASIYEHVRRDRSRAVDICLSAEQAAPGHAGVLAMLARLQQEVETWEPAIATLERLAAVTQGEPHERAEFLARAGELARTHLADPVEAARLFEAALVADKGCLAALRALSAIYRERGDLERAVRMVLDAIAMSDSDSIGRLAFEAAELYQAMGDRASAIAFYRDALDCDPDLVIAATPLAELLWQDQQHGELVAVLEEIVRREASGDVALLHLTRLARAYAVLGLDKRALVAARRALALTPDDDELLRLEADLYFRCEMWSDASRALQFLIASKGQTTKMRLELLHRSGVVAARLGEPDRACYWFRQALALEPHHRPTLSELLPVVDRDPRTKLGVLRALADSASGRERTELLCQLGDLLADRLRDPDGALAAYYQALEASPQDHRLLHKCLDLLSRARRWGECEELFARLIKSEASAPVRAKVRHAAALLSIEELGQPEAAEKHLWAAIEDDPDLKPAREALEEMLRKRGAWDELASLYCKLLPHFGRDRGEQENEEIDRERLRLWLGLADVCWSQLGQRDTALDALDVAARLAPNNAELKTRLAERLLQAGPAHRRRAIALHQELLVAGKRHAPFYRALERLYRDDELYAHAGACTDAHAFAGTSSDSAAVAPRRDRPRFAGRSLTSEMWTSLRHPDEDALSSALFALVAPVVAGTHAQSYKRLVLEMRGADALPDDSVAGRMLSQVAPALGVARPPIISWPDGRVPVDVCVATDKSGARPVLVLGGALLQGASERRVAFELGRALASLRGGGILRWLMPRVEQLAQLIDAAIAFARLKSPSSSDSGPLGLNATLRTLERMLTPIQQEQLVAIGGRLADRGQPAESQATAWLQAHDLSLARVGLVACGDLATSLEVLRGDPPSSGRHSLDRRVDELLWSSVTEPVLDARAHLEGWYAADDEEMQIGSRDIIISSAV